MTLPHTPTRDRTAHPQVSDVTGERTYGLPVRISAATRANGVSQAHTRIYTDMIVRLRARELRARVRPHSGANRRTGWRRTSWRPRRYTCPGRHQRRQTTTRLPRWRALLVSATTVRHPGPSLHRRRRDNIIISGIYGPSPSQVKDLCNQIWDTPNQHHPQLRKAAKDELGALPEPDTAQLHVGVTSRGEGKRRGGAVQVHHRLRALACFQTTLEPI